MKIVCRKTIREKDLPDTNAGDKIIFEEGKEYNVVFFPCKEKEEGEEEFEYITLVANGEDGKPYKINKDILPFETTKFALVNPESPEEIDKLVNELN